MFIFPLRAQDIKAKKHHIPIVDRTPLEPPPVVIVVVGPPKVGKSTLIRCLIKNFTRQKLADICGPITIVSGTLTVINTFLHSVPKPHVVILQYQCYILHHTSYVSMTYNQTVPKSFH